MKHYRYIIGYTFSGRETSVQFKLRLGLKEIIALNWKRENVPIVLSFFDSFNFHLVLGLLPFKTNHFVKTNVFSEDKVAKEMHSFSQM